MISALFPPGNTDCLLCAARPSRHNQKKREKDESIRANLRQYGLESQYLDVLVADASKHDLWRHLPLFDAIITDREFAWFLLLVSEMVLRVQFEAGLLPELAMASSVSWGMDFSCSVWDAVWLLCNLVSAASGFYHPHLPFCIPLSLSLPPVLSLAFSLSHSLPFSFPLFLSFFLSLSLPPYFLSPPFLPLSLSHTHTHTTHACPHSLSLSLMWRFTLFTHCLKKNSLSSLTCLWRHLPLTYFQWEGCQVWAASF